MGSRGSSIGIDSIREVCLLSHPSPGCPLLYSVRGNRISHIEEAESRLDHGGPHQTTYRSQEP